MSDSGVAELLPAPSEIDSVVPNDTAGVPLPAPPATGADRSKEEAAASNKSAHIEVFFNDPEEGTPAAAALAANAELQVSKASKIWNKLRGLKRPKLKSLNLVKQLKKHTKARRKHKNFKGKVIDGQHELYIITAGIMLGIKCSLSHLQELGDDQMLTLEAFNYVEKVSFPALGGDDAPYPTPPHSLVRTFKFKTYAPLVFARLRNLCDIPTDGYMESICGNYSFLEFMSNSKSGQFFFYSHDGKYMLKTQTKEENKFMKRILPHYYKYLAENPHSLLVRILGMHRVKMYQIRRKIHFVIMTSVFDTPEQIHTMYDLKGSLVGRSATPKEKARGGVMKDLDLLERTSTGTDKIHFGPKRHAFLRQIELDSQFLASLGIMDYSLLLGVHFRDRRPGLDVSIDESASLPPPQSDTGVGSGSGNSHSVPHNLGGVPAPRASATAAASSSMHSHSDTPMRRAMHDQALRVAAQASGAASPDDGSGSSANVDPEGAVGRERSPSMSEGGVAVVAAANSGVDSLGVELIVQAQGQAQEQGSSLPASASAAAVSFKPINISRGSGTGNQHSALNKAAAAAAAEYESLNDAEAEGEAESDTSYADTSDDDSVFESQDPSAAHANGAGAAYNDHDGTSKLLNRHVAYSDSNGLKYPEGGRLSWILSPRDHSPTTSPDKAAPSTTRGATDTAASATSSAGASRNSATHTSTNKRSSAKGGRALSGTSTSELGEDIHPLSSQAVGGDTAVKAYFGPHPWTSRDDGGINSRTASGARGNEIYYCGIIDILQSYNLRKQSECLIRSLYLDTEKISAVNPTRYAKRFVKFLGENID